MPVRNSVRGEASNCTGFFQRWTYWLGDQLGSIKLAVRIWCLWSVLMGDSKRQTIIPLTLNIKHKRVALKCSRRKELLVSFWSVGRSSRFDTGMCLTWCTQVYFWTAVGVKLSFQKGMNTQLGLMQKHQQMAVLWDAWGIAAISAFCSQMHLDKGRKCEHKSKNP